MQQYCYIWSQGHTQRRGWEVQTHNQKSKTFRFFGVINCSVNSFETPNFVLFQFNISEQQLHVYNCIMHHVSFVCCSANFWLDCNPAPTVVKFCARFAYGRSSVSSTACVSLSVCWSRPRALHNQLSGSRCRLECGLGQAR